MRICNNFFIGLVIAVLLALIHTPSTQACTYTVSENQVVMEGEIAYYYIEITNTRQPLGVDVRIESSQDPGSFDVENSEIHLEIQQTAFVHYYIYTDSPDIDLIVTSFQAYEKEAYQDEYSLRTQGHFKTTIIHPPPPIPHDENETARNIFLGVLGVSLGVIVFLWIFRARVLMFFPGYTKLNPDAIFDNERRAKIYDAVVTSGSNGTTLTEIAKEINQPIFNTLVFHLHQLIKHGHIRKVDRRYYVKDILTYPSLKYRIIESIDNGSISIIEIS